MGASAVRPMTDLESQPPPEDAATQVDAHVSRARRSVSFASSFCVGLVVIWAGLVAISFARDSTDARNTTGTRSIGRSVGSRRRRYRRGPMFTVKSRPLHNVIDRYMPLHTVTYRPLGSPRFP